MKKTLLKVLLLRLSQGAISLLMIYSAFTKVSDMELFLEIITYYKYIPDSLHFIVGYTVPAIELLIGIGIWLIPRQTVWIYQVLILVFFIFLLLNLGVYLPKGCGCFGKKDFEKVTWLFLVRDFMFFIPAWIYLLIKKHLNREV